MDGMRTAHETVAGFIRKHGIDMADFNEWFADAGHPQAEANVHDSRYLDHLRRFVEERDAG